MVFFCVFWISILIGSYSSSQKTADETDNPSISVENPDSHTIYKTKINTLYNYNHDVASAVDRLYQSDESDADKQAKATVLQQYDNIINNGISADNISEDEISEDDLLKIVFLKLLLLKKVFLMTLLLRKVFLMITILKMNLQLYPRSIRILAFQ